MRLSCITSNLKIWLLNISCLLTHVSFKSFDLPKVLHQSVGDAFNEPIDFQLCWVLVKHVKITTVSLFMNIFSNACMPICFTSTSTVYNGCRTEIPKTM